jgi:quercetin dioxygenase-like cupin family protein
MGRYVAGSSPWERHNNGDELLLVTDGEVQMGMSKNPQEDLKKAYKMG